MNKRKTELRALFAADMPAAPAPQQPAEPAQEAARRPSSGAVKAMGLALDTLTREAAEARRLRESMESGERIAEIDPALIDPSLIADRLDTGGGTDAAFEALKASMAENGQQVPVLVRVHPDQERAAQGRYQAAYGHRRIRAALELGINVQAIVRKLDDTALLLAQGKDNAIRRDRSYIERALFARSILKAGHDRHTAQAALGVDKTEISRMIQVADAIPERIVRAIGPAPRIGRPRWLELGSFLEREAAQVSAADLISSESFRRHDSDKRFALLHGRLAPRARLVRAALERQSQPSFTGGGGRVVATLKPGKSQSRLEISGEDHKDFAAFVAGQLPALAEAFAARGSSGEEGGGDVA